MPGQHPLAAHAQTLSCLCIASPTEFEIVATLFAELHQYNASLDAHFALAEGWRDLLEEHFQRTYTLPSALWLLAWVNDLPAGLLILEHHLDSPFFRHHAWIELVALYVRPVYRGMGLAQHLMREGSLWARAHGVACMQLYVTTTNESARAFYRKCGWKPVQEIWRLEMQGQEPMEQLGDPSCGPEAERQAEVLEHGHQLARETRYGSEQVHPPRTLHVGASGEKRKEDIRDAF
jgi:ribosomal protein S18 acetylase RimI-like enzyme